MSRRGKSLYQTKLCSTEGFEVIYLLVQTDLELQTVPKAIGWKKSGNTDVGIKEDSQIARRERNSDYWAQNNRTGIREGFPGGR